MNDAPEPEGEDEGVLRIFCWFDDELVDEDEQWAALYDGYDEYDGAVERLRDSASGLPPPSRLRWLSHPAE
jgi:hypothetical protein